MNHEGSFDVALELVRRAKAAGADILKVQFGWREGPGELNEFMIERAGELKEFCDECQIEMMASVITEAGFDRARELELDRFKIASRTVVDNPELCRAVLAEGRETFISLGMWEGPGWPFDPPDDRVHYVYCRSKYPTSAADLRDMPAAFSLDGFYGYSDHCLGIAACTIALGRGAHFIEKHFTLNKASTSIRDHILSATPEEFELLVSLGREVFRVGTSMMNVDVSNQPIGG